MTTELFERIKQANNDLLRSADRLLSAADDLRRDKGRLIDLLKRATPAAGATERNGRGHVDER